MEITTRRRRALSTALALLLALESVSAVAAVAVVSRDATGARHDLPATAPAGIVYGALGRADTTPAADVAVARTAPRGALGRTAPADSAARGPARTSPRPAARAAAFAPKAAISTVRKPKASHRSASSSAPSGGAGGSGSAKSGSYKGSNRFWFPALGISRSVYSYPCSRKSALANIMYRWGCAGSNNVYIMGHAWGVMKPLHDAYVNGRLRAGMKTYYADGRGRTHTYKIKWWKLTRPTTSASWAWASLGVPSMTLQTCIGAHSEYRLMVRLVEVH
jgi:hypothetical protein